MILLDAIATCGRNRGATMALAKPKRTARAVRAKPKTKTAARRKTPRKR
jgi:hypothetical protein